MCVFSFRKNITFLTCCGRKRGQYRLKVVSNATLPLRGFLLCPECGKVLTGSASKGHTKYYSYYHCYAGCSFRQRADGINQLLHDELKKYIPRPEMADIYKLVLQQAWQSQTSQLQDDRKQTLKQIGDLENKLGYIRELLSSKQIEPADFREMKLDYTAKVEKLEAKLSASNNELIDIKGLLNKGVDNLLRLDTAYEIAEAEKKREIISSMFPEKMTFENNLLRTGRVNEAVNYIYLINSSVGGNKKGQNGNKSILSCQVGKTGFEPATT